MQTERRLRWNACFNVRDLGGYPLIDGGETRWRAVVRADTLCRLTETGRAALVDYGVRTIIDLRSARELEAVPHPFAADGNGIRYANLPVVSEEARPALAAATSAADSYRTMIDLCRREFGRIVAAVASAPAGGVALHCHAGKDRTGIVVALLLRLAGVGDAVIAEDYVLSDLGLQQVYQEWIAEAGDPRERERRAREAVSRPESILAMLAHVDARHGGVERYLLDAGVEPADLARLRERLRV